LNTITCTDPSTGELETQITKYQSNLKQIEDLFNLPGVYKYIPNNIKTLYNSLSDSTYNRTRKKNAVK
jgi:hypothetical protein